MNFKAIMFGLTLASLSICPAISFARPDNDEGDACLPISIAPPKYDKMVWNEVFETGKWSPIGINYSRNQDQWPSSDYAVIGFRLGGMATNQAVSGFSLCFANEDNVASWCMRMGGVNKAKTEKYSIDISLLNIINTDFSSFFLGDIPSASDSRRYGSSGIQIGALLGNFALCDYTGVQLAGLINRSEKMYGVQLAGFINVAEDALYGIQIGTINGCERGPGLQIGGINFCNDKTFLQIGGINRCKTLAGIQIGGINSAVAGRGIQIGWANKLGDQISPLINAKF